MFGIHTRRISVMCPAKICKPAKDGCIASWSGSRPLLILSPTFLKSPMVPSPFVTCGIPMSPRCCTMFLMPTQIPAKFSQFYHRKNRQKILIYVIICFKTSIMTYSPPCQKERLLHQIPDNRPKNRCSTKKKHQITAFSDCRCLVPFFAFFIKIVTWRSHKASPAQEI